MNMKNLKYKNVVSPVASYNNAYLLKDNIFIENKNKSGIYLWVNNINNNIYVGSAKNLNRRLKSYFSNYELGKNNKPINAALLKYGADNFGMVILEYCEKHLLMEREQYYLDLLLPEYNILTKAYSLEFEHSEKTIANLKAKTVERKGMPVSVINIITEESKDFKSQTDAAEYIGVTRQAIYKALK